MAYLVAVSLIWAFSFGLIKNELTGLDPTAIAVVRLALASLCFLPFLRLHGTSVRQRLQLAATGALQFGLMYVFYLHAFLHLRAFEVALFTITTPLYIALLDAALERRVEHRHWIAALLSVAGAGVVLWRTGVASTQLGGVLLVQLSNLSFAAGQLAYRRIRGGMTGVGDANSFVWLYLGGLAITLVMSVVAGSWTTFSPTARQWGILAYLGMLASGFCFFWWNRGATRVNAGLLAAMNNAKVPLGVACSLLFFQESTDLARLLAGGALMAVGLWVAGGARR